MTADSRLSAGEMTPPDAVPDLRDVAYHCRYSDDGWHVPLFNVVMGEVCGAVTCRLCAAELREGELQHLVPSGHVQRYYEAPVVVDRAALSSSPSVPTGDYICGASGPLSEDAQKELDEFRQWLTLPKPRPEFRAWQKQPRDPVAAPSVPREAASEARTPWGRCNDCSEPLTRDDGLTHCAKCRRGHDIQHAANVIEDHAVMCERLAEKIDAEERAAELYCPSSIPASLLDVAKMVRSLKPAAAPVPREGTTDEPSDSEIAGRITELEGLIQLYVGFAAEVRERNWGEHSARKYDTMAEECRRELRWLAALRSFRQNEERLRRDAEQFRQIYDAGGIGYCSMCGNNPIARPTCAECDGAGWLVVGYRRLWGWSELRTPEMTEMPAYLEDARRELAASRQREQERDAIFRWLLGEEHEFVTPPERVLEVVAAGKKAAPGSRYVPLYWWRSALRERLAAVSSGPSREEKPTNG